MAIEKYSDRDFEALQRRIQEMEQWKTQNAPMIQKLFNTAAEVDNRIAKRILDLENWKAHSASASQKPAEAAADLSRRLEKADQQLEAKIAALRKQVDTLARNAK